MPKNRFPVFLFLKLFSQLGETVSRPGTGLGLSRPGTGKIWTVEGDEALEDRGEDVKSMSPTGISLYSGGSVGITCWSSS